jgi:hypothetical protein
MIDTSTNTRSKVLPVSFSSQYVRPHVRVGHHGCHDLTSISRGSWSLAVPTEPFEAWLQDNSQLCSDSHGDSEAKIEDVQPSGLRKRIQRSRSRDRTTSVHTASLTLGPGTKL